MLHTHHPVARVPRLSQLGESARRGTALSRELGVATSRREANEPSPDDNPGADPMGTDDPWGLWPRTTEPEAVSYGHAALDRYAASLRTREKVKQPPARGIPLVSRRRGGTERGADSGPGGLGRHLAPEDVLTDTAALLNRRRSAPAPTPSPQPPRRRGA